MAGKTGGVVAVVVAAGSGTRASEGRSTLPKQYQPLAGEAMLARTLRIFLDHPRVDRVAAVISPEHLDLYRAATAHLDGLDPPVIGGATRQLSCGAGVEAFAAHGPSAVLIHDAARPFLAADVIDRLIDGLAEAPGVLAALPVVDTLKRAGAENRVGDTVPRDGLWGAQTPQGFRFALIREAHARALAAGRSDFTDDAAVAEWAGIPVTLVKGDPANVKVTTAADMAAAESAFAMQDYTRLADIRVATAYDVHPFEPGDGVWLCGVKIPHDLRLKGHSDADVALHALTDAIYGALGDGDLGVHFPPSNQAYRGMASSVFLEHAMGLIRARGGVLAHADVSIIAEEPKITPHREAMRARIAEICGISLDRVGVKATTNEKLGFVGRGEGIAAIGTATVRLPVGSER